MEKKDLERFRKLIQILAEDKGAKVSEGRMELLWGELKQHPIEKIEAAVKELARSRKYAGFPSLADFIELLEGDTNARIVEASKKAFDTLWREGESIGYNAWEDPIIPIVIHKLGGWINQTQEVDRICRLKDSQIQEGIWRKNFEIIYRAEARKPGPKVIPKMIGATKLENEAEGYLTDDQGNPECIWTEHQRRALKGAETELT